MLPTIIITCVAIILTLTVFNRLNCILFWMLVHFWGCLHYSIIIFEVTWYCSTGLFIMINVGMIFYCSCHSTHAVTNGHRSNFFPIRAVDVWNSLPQSVVEAQSINSYKNPLPIDIILIKCLYLILTCN